MPSCGSPLVSRIEQRRKNLVANCFRNFSKNKKKKQKQKNELSQMYRKENKCSKNNKFNKDCKL